MRHTECHTLKRENEENIIKSEFFVKFCLHLVDDGKEEYNMKIKLAY